MAKCKFNGCSLTARHNGKHRQRRSAKKNPMVNESAYPPGFYKQYDPEYHVQGYNGVRENPDDRPWDYMRDTYSTDIFPYGMESTNNGKWYPKGTGVAKYNGKKRRAKENSRGFTGYQGRAAAERRVERRVDDSSFGQGFLLLKAKKSATYHVEQLYAAGVISLKERTQALRAIERARTMRASVLRRLASKALYEDID